MQELQPYEYAVIRVVPKVEREEFLNVGVILFSKRNKFLGLKTHLDPIRISAFAPELDIEEVRDYLHSWELICAGDPAGGVIAQQDQAGRFRWLTATRSTIIQNSKAHPGLCSEPAKVLDQLFEKYVG